MTAMTKRGFLPSDASDFGADSLPKLKTAADEISYLLNRGYPVASATRFVGDHYQLSDRQRLALARTVSSDACIRARKCREVSEIAGETLYIDGFNVIIGLEIAYSRSMLFACMDGTIRDLAGLHGSYRLIPETDSAIRALLNTLGTLHIRKAVMYLDQPISNSGKLKQRILSLSENNAFDLEVLTENPVDAILKTKPLIASGDAFILDACERWFNLTRAVIAMQIGDYPYLSLIPE